MNETIPQNIQEKIADAMAKNAMTSNKVPHLIETEVKGAGVKTPPMELHGVNTIKEPEVKVTEYKFAHIIEVSKGKDLPEGYELLEGSELADVQQCTKLYKFTAQPLTVEIKETLTRSLASVAQYIELITVDGEIDTDRFLNMDPEQTYITFSSLRFCAGLVTGMEKNFFQNVPEFHLFEFYADLLLNTPGMMQRIMTFLAGQRKVVTQN